MNEAEVAAVIDTATHGVLEPIASPPRRTRVNPFPPPSEVAPPLHLQVSGLDSQETQDSLSFPTTTNVPGVPPIDYANELKTTNEFLKNYLSEIIKQYYHWKIACIMSVDRARQMYNEFQKIDNDYIKLNQRRDFGLTSWASVDAMFPDEMATKPGSNSIDWMKAGWPYETARSSNEKDRRILWPKPASFVTDGTCCPICSNQFGPEGGWSLGTCQCMYHPMCLISHALIRRFCAICKAPFHERLYEQFGLEPYMPPSWEKNPDNTPDMPNLWGEDLIWNWRMKMHSAYKNNMSTQFMWEHDPAEIVRVSHRICNQGSAEVKEGKRNFFYQVLGGYWDESAKKFQFGTHPLGFRWNMEGKLVVDQHKELLQLTPEDINICNALNMEESEWREKFKSTALDYLLEEHTPETIRVLRQMRDSKFLEVIMGADGPATRTRAAKRRLQINDGAESSAAGSSRARTDDSGPSRPGENVMEINE